LSLLGRSSKRRLSGDYLPRDLYSTLEELPWIIWVKIQETGELSLLSKNGNQFSNSKLADAWALLEDQYFREHGQTEDYTKWIRLRMEIHEMRLEFLIEQDRKILNFIEQKEAELKEMEESGEKIKFDEVIPSLEIRLKFTLNENLISTKKVYQYIEILSKKPASVRSDR